MSHPLARLVEIRHKLDTFSDGQLGEFVNFLIDENHQSILISGIFRQLYSEASNNEILTKISTKIDEIFSLRHRRAKKTHYKSSATRLTDLADSLLCKIGSYLSTKEIFTSWTHVSRRFLEIGMKPETLHSWDFDESACKNVADNVPRCDFHSITTNMNRAIFNHHFDNIVKYINLSNFKKLKHLEICMFICIFLVRMSTILCSISSF